MPSVHPRPAEESPLLKSTTKVDIREALPIWTCPLRLLAGPERPVRDLQRILYYLNLQSYAKRGGLGGTSGRTSICSQM